MRAAQVGCTLKSCFKRISRAGGLCPYRINFNKLPCWQRWGTELYWKIYPKIRYNPILGQEVITTRRRIKINQDLPMKEAYREGITELLENRETVKRDRP